MSASSNKNAIFDTNSRAAFLLYVKKNPSNRRVSQVDKDNMMKWITNTSERPSSQQEFSRRNYVQKAFKLDENTKGLVAVGKSDEDKCRPVVTEDMILDVVESAHVQNGHLGWDATWRDITASYYGILRSDVIFLLKQCKICAHNPSKRPRSAANLNSDSQMLDPEILKPT
ncbi:hypothetical protein ACLMJK_004473 [Lecanora helva]